MSDWSSDVCSSDLAGPRLEQRVRARGDGGGRRGGGGRFGGGCDAHLAITHHHRGGCKQDRQRTDERLRGARHKHISPEDKVSNETMSRSEEHTSELQSLMRISYAVFCLKKKK